jgi:hypothetical protein
MFKGMTKPTYQGFITCNESVTDLAEEYWTETEIVNGPVTLNTFIKRKDDYLFIKRIAPFDNAPFMVDGFSVSIEKYRHYMICEILGEDL